MALARPFSGFSGGASGFEAGDLSVLEKLWRFPWLLALLIVGAAAVGFLMLYSVAGGSLDPWTRSQIVRFSVGFGLMVMAAMIDIRVWRAAAPLFYFAALAMLAMVELDGRFARTGMGATRWLDLGFIQVQPSEPMKIALVMVLARYYAWIDPRRLSHPLSLIPPIGFALLPAVLVAAQPDLGTALLLIAGAGVVMFLAGVSWWFFGLVITAGAGAIYAIFASRGTEWQLLKDYQFRRIETFLDPSLDPLGAGYHITQSTIAIGSGGYAGKGFMQGSQTHLSFLPEPHTDFIFTTLAEEFGFVGGLGVLLLYMAIVLVSMGMAIRMKDAFCRLLAGGIVTTFFFLFALNMSMVMGLTPVVGVPLPLVSYGGTSMMVVLFGFGLLMSAHIHSVGSRRR